MRSDIEIAQSAAMRPITEIAAGLGLGENDIDLYGRYKAKVRLDSERAAAGGGKLVLVTGITDHVLVVGLARDGPELGENEWRLDEIWRRTRPPRRSLVLLHTPGAIPKGTSAWLEKRDVERHYHVRGERVDDVERLARLLSGNGVGLVLGGGGARGFAHLGVLRPMAS
jgi:hypothetical protein